jgi:hypothetical protein
LETDAEYAKHSAENAEKSNFTVAPHEAGVVGRAHRFEQGFGRK